MIRRVSRNPHFEYAVEATGWRQGSSVGFIYIELLTRITTQPLANEEDIEQAALYSVY